MLNSLLQQKKLLLLFGISILLIIIIFVLLISVTITPKTPITNIPTPTPVIINTKTSQEQKISVLQKAVNSELPQKIESSPDFESKIVLPNGNTQYNLKSPLIRRKNEIITNNGQVIFERILTPEKSTTTGYARISEFTSVFGQPQKTIKGSNFYGSFISTLIYADKGFTLIGNRRSNEVYEIQTYHPMSVDNYIQQFGQDINEEEENPL